MKLLKLLPFLFLLSQNIFGQICLSNNDTVLLYNYYFNVIKTTEKNCLGQRLTIFLGEERYTAFCTDASSCTYSFSLRLEWVKKDTILIMKILDDNKKLLVDSFKVKIIPEPIRVFMTGATIGAIALRDKEVVQISEKYMREINALKVQSLIPNRIGSLGHVKYFYYRKEEKTVYDGDFQGQADSEFLQYIKIAKAGDTVYFERVLTSPARDVGCFGPLYSFQIEVVK